MKGRIDARNSLETYCFNAKNTLEEKLGEKIGQDEKDMVRCSSPLAINVNPSDSLSVLFHQFAHLARCNMYCSAASTSCLVKTAESKRYHSFLHQRLRIQPNSLRKHACM